MRPHLALAAVLLLAACASDPEPQAAPTRAPTRASTAAPSTAAPFDPTHLIKFVASPADVEGTDRTWTMPVGGTGAGQRLRPGRWRTPGGPCKYVAPDAEGNTYELISNVAFARAALVLLPAGSTFVVVNAGRIGFGDCVWAWDGALP